MQPEESLPLVFWQIFTVDNQYIGMHLIGNKRKPQMITHTPMHTQTVQN